MNTITLSGYQQNNISQELTAFLYLLKTQKQPHDISGYTITINYTFNHQLQKCSVDWEINNNWSRYSLYMHVFPKVEAQTLYVGGINQPID